MVKLPPLLANHDINLLLQLYRKADHIQYKLGSKIPLDAQVKDVQYCDCSGFVRWILNHWLEATGECYLVDGSVNQHQQFKDNKIDLLIWPYPNSEYVYIGFLSPNDTASEIGHVFLIYQNLTIECCGSLGVCRRDVNSLKWLKNCTFYRIN